MEELDDNEDYGVGFLYKTMRERDPKKRRVKPVDAHLLQLDFGGLEDSSDDSDYEVANHKGDNSDADSDDGGSSGSSDSDEDSSKSEDESEEKTNERSDDDNQTVEDLIANLKRNSPKAEDSSLSRVASSAKLLVRICSVCLGDFSEEDDEIVECDSCGITVHEGCYGVSENQSVGSTVSSASTEPWFCDACKAGVKPHCELCPNFGGIYKETDAGKWVHVVCALYIHGVAFGDVDLLSPVTLLEMPYSKWGARECTLCEDARFSRTGVAIGCDAGMCRNYFHVSCAQREGLLSEASPDEDIADPFFAYCKQHVDKNGQRIKRRNFLAVQSNWKKPCDKTEGDELDCKEKARVERKLKGHRQKYLSTRTNRYPTWVPTEKLPRLLTTSPSAMRRLLRKAELLGITTQVSASQKTDIRKKYHVAPAFSVDFISYFLDRNTRIKNGKSHLRDHLLQNEKLNKQEKILRAKYDKLHAEVEKENQRNNQLRCEAEKLYEILGKINGKPVPLPKVLRTKKMAKKKQRDKPKSLPAVIHSCGICERSNDQHLLAHCDTCKKYYHLGCVDPPLTRMPKKTKLMGWQCSECDSSESDDSDTNEGVDTNAPRKLRESHQLKLPAKFTPPPKESRKEGGVAKDRKGKRKRKKSKKLLQAEDDEQEKEMPILKKEKPLKVREHKPPKPRDVRTQCCVCLLPGDNNNLVRCDECKLCYHFGCLDPPLKKSPKQRGYAWHCTACDPTESDANDEDGDDDDDGEDEGETLEMEEEEDPLEPPKLEKVPKQDESAKGEKEAISQHKSSVPIDAKKSKSLTTLDSTATSSSPTKSAATGSNPEVTPATIRKKTPTKNKCEEKENSTVKNSPVRKQIPSRSSHDAMVFHVSQDTTNCTPLPVLKPIASSTPDLCYVGTEDIAPKDGLKRVKNKKKSCSKKENKGAMKQNPESNCADVPKKKKAKNSDNKFNVKSENANGSIDVTGENETTSEKPTKKKKKKSKKPKDVVENGDGKISEVNGIQKKKDKVLPKVKEELTEVNAEESDQKVNVGAKKKKRKADSETVNADMEMCSKNKKKKLNKKNNGVPKKKSVSKTTKGAIKIEPLDTSSDLNASLENQAEDSVDLSALLHKKPTAESLALQATVEKLQGRLTPTLYQGNNTNSVNINGKNANPLHALVPNLPTSRTDDHSKTSQDKVSQSIDCSKEHSTADEEVMPGGRSKSVDNRPLSPDAPLSLSSSEDTVKEMIASNIKSVTDSKPVTDIDMNSSLQSSVLDLSNKGKKSTTIVRNDGSIDLSMKDNLQVDQEKSVHQTPAKLDLLGRQTSPMHDFDILNRESSKNTNGPSAICAPQDSNTAVDGEKHHFYSKAGKKERVESAIERLFKKRDNTNGSGVKKQRIEKTIDMLLAKKEKTDEGTEKGMPENFHRKSIDTDIDKDNRS